MTVKEAKQILLVYRPGRDEVDTQISQALELARTDAALGGWWTEQQQYHAAVAKKFQELPVPAGLKDAILAQQKIVRPQPWWQHVQLQKLAALFVVCGVLAFIFLKFSNQPPKQDRFVDYRSRMVRSALREYQMDVVTNDLAQLRSWISSRGGPSDFVVPKKLSELSLSGGGVLRWRNNPVSMVCYDRGDKQMLFLFVIDRSALKDAPPSNAELEEISTLKSASWTEGEKTYILAGPMDVPLEKYF